MAGLYIHIPYCAKLCHYCDFHFSVSYRTKEKMIPAICKELTARKEYLGDEKIGTIYIGGGTPSILKMDEVTKIFNSINDNYFIEGTPEITFEANPEDLTLEYVKDLKNHSPVNRLSIGIQSFINRDLEFMNRRHTASESLKAVENANAAGIKKINIDLIYGIPGMSVQEWENNLDIAEKLEIQHISAYHLTVEPKTVFAYKLKKGLFKQVTEKISKLQFELLSEKLEKAGFEHYEISNFAKPGFYSIHNTNYWLGENYLGIGPSAHSYNGISRQWNISNNSMYIENISTGKPYFEVENLSDRDLCNEYILLSLRTRWGMDIRKISGTFGENAALQVSDGLRSFIDTGDISRNGKHYILTKKGKLIADYIISRIMI